MALERPEVLVDQGMKQALEAMRQYGRDENCCGGHSHMVAAMHSVGTSLENLAAVGERYAGKADVQELERRLGNVEITLKDLAETTDGIAKQQTEHVNQHKVVAAGMKRGDKWFMVIVQTGGAIVVGLLALLLKAHGGG